MTKKNSKVNTQPFWRFLFVLYCALMLWLLFGRPRDWAEGLTYQQMLSQNINLTPLLTIKNYYYVVQQGAGHPYFSHCVINLLGNILLFVPAGWLLPKVFQKQRKFFRFFFTCLGLILLVETLQLFTLLGSFDVDDVLLNMGGMLAGFVFYKLLAAIRKG